MCHPVAKIMIRTWDTLVRALDNGRTRGALPVDGGALRREGLALVARHAGAGAVVVGARRARVLLEAQDVEDPEQP